MNLRYKKIKSLKESTFSLTKDNVITLLNEIAIYADQLAEDARELTYSLDNGELNSIPKRDHAGLDYIEIKNRMEKILNSNMVEGLNEALYGMNQIEQFVKMADAIGLKTMSDFKDFMDREGQGKDVLTALYDYLHNEIGDLDFHAKDESLKESLTKSDRDIILDVVKGKYETGHGYLEDKRDYEEALGRRLTDAKYEQLEEFYGDLMDLGPEGFYEEYKDMLDFDPDFIAEYGYSEDDEEEDELEESLKEDLAVNGEETPVDTVNEPTAKPAVIIIKIESSISADGFEVTVKDTAGNIIDQQSFRYGYNASYSKLGVDKYKPFVTDIINRYLSKYNLNKDNIIVTKGKNIFKGTDVSDEDITDFKNNYLGNHLDESKDESLKEGYLDNIKNPDYWKHQVDYQLEKFGRVGGGLIQDLDEAGFYLDADNKVVKKLHEDTIKNPKIKWTFIKSKEVEDSDGFLTDYT